jgi:hypothetical protein
MSAKDVQHLESLLRGATANLAARQPVSSQMGQVFADSIDRVLRTTLDELAPGEESHLRVLHRQCHDGGAVALRNRQLLDTSLLLVSRLRKRLEKEESATGGPRGVHAGATPAAAAHDSFVSQLRLEDLAKLSSPDYDFRRLHRLCEELNICFEHGCWSAVAALTRAVLDHVPPLFGVKGFAEIANNAMGAKSFKDSMLNLSNSARKIGDAHLHVQIRKKESLPTKQQVNCSADIDVLLAEIVRLHRA